MFGGHVCLQSLGGKNLILFLHYYNVRSYLFISSIFVINAQRSMNTKKMRKSQLDTIFDMTHIFLLS